mmetsp:Transcript_8590/g.20516  ORF Transcript_8590/g.20516 Transcript_8590/m.20516 type:complete len:272 (-) Transcript_8590:1199-2014(-)
MPILLCKLLLVLGIRSGGLDDLVEFRREAHSQRRPEDPPVGVHDSLDPLHLYVRPALEAVPHFLVVLGAESPDGELVVRVVLGQDRSDRKDGLFVVVPLLGPGRVEIVGRAGDPRVAVRCGKIDGDRQAYLAPSGQVIDELRPGGVVAGRGGVGGRRRLGQRRRCHSFRDPGRRVGVSPRGGGRGIVAVVAAAAAAVSVPGPPVHDFCLHGHAPAGSFVVLLAHVEADVVLVRRVFLRRVEESPDGRFEFAHQLVPPGPLVVPDDDLHRAV